MQHPSKIKTNSKSTKHTRTSKFINCPPEKQYSCFTTHTHVPARTYVRAFVFRYKGTSSSIAENAEYHLHDFNGDSAIVGSFFVSAWKSTCCQKSVPPSLCIIAYLGKVVVEVEIAVVFPQP